jgi:hypothetical protein
VCTFSFLTLHFEDHVKDMNKDFSVIATKVTSSRAQFDGSLTTERLLSPPQSSQRKRSPSGDKNGSFDKFRKTGLLEVSELFITAEKKENKIGEGQAIELDTAKEL